MESTGHQSQASALGRQAAVPLCPLPSSDVIFPWTPLEVMEKTDYDVIIAGTGAGGGAVLWRLAQQWGNNGKRIGVIEAGDYILPAHKYDLPDWKPLSANVEPPNRVYWDAVPIYPSERTYQSPDLLYPFEQFFGLGGRSIIWGIVTPRMTPADISSWPVSLKEMNMYYNIAEEVMNVNRSFYRTAPFLLNRLRRSGFSEAITTPVAVDIQPTANGEFHATPRFTTMELFADAARRRPFDTAIRSRVVQVYTEKGKAAGLRVMSREKKSYFLKAKTIVLATSTFETPRILLYSGIRGEAIGRYLVSHSRLQTLAKVSPRDFLQNPGQFAIFVASAPGRPFQLQMRGFPPAGQVFDILGAGEVESRFENRVALTPAELDAYGVPKAAAYFSYSDRDLEVIRQMEAGIKQAGEAMQVELDPICQLPLGLVMHDMGTCRIGTNPYSSAADPYGQIHGTAGLYVASSSMIPTGGTVNPFLTITALSIRTADFIVQQLK